MVIKVEFTYIVLVSIKSKRAFYIFFVEAFTLVGKRFSNIFSLVNILDKWEEILKDSQFLILLKNSLVMPLVITALN